MRDGHPGLSGKQMANRQPLGRARRDAMAPRANPQMPLVHRERAAGSDLGLSYTSFSLTLIGGMTTATLLTLLVVPVFYTFFDDARAAVSGVVKQAMGKRRKAAATPSV